MVLVKVKAIILLYLIIYVHKLEFLVAGLPDDVRRLIELGEFKQALACIDRWIHDKRTPKLMKLRLEYEKERLARIEYDYSFSREEAFNKLKGEIPDLSEEDFEKWIKEGYIDCRLINGELRFFRTFIPNLFRFCEEAEKRRIKKVDEKREKARKALHEHVDKLIELGQKTGQRFLLPVKNTIRMKITVKPRIVPVGEKIRVWMPLPRRDPLQPEVKIISAKPEPTHIAPENHIHRTIYFEQTVENEDKSLEFEVVYEYTVRGFYLKVDPSKVEPYDESEEIYSKYIIEEPPHIVFTPYLRKLAEEIVGSEKNPYLKAKKIYYWITTHVKYASAYEYSTYECISEYVARNLKGDCGMQALLFITLCRIAGIPARWQSGWYINPYLQSPHDWAQFYIRPYGWLYADCSFGGARIKEPKYHEFYFGNIDRCRLVANIAISEQFEPPKQHIRSDPVDNQRGEVEWRGGNLYYDKWSYKLELIKYEEVA